MGEKNFLKKVDDAYLEGIESYKGAIKAIKAIGEKEVIKGINANEFGINENKRGIKEEDITL